MSVISFFRNYGVTRDHLSESRFCGFSIISAAIKGKITKKKQLLKFSRPDVKHPFYLRVPSTDVSTFRQIFMDRLYNFDVSRAPTTIIDAGANIGLTSILFSNRFPESKIVAIEPSNENFEILKLNVAPYHNIIPIRGALWHENVKIDLVDPGLGEWGFMTEAQNGSEKCYDGIVLNKCLQEVQGITLDTIMEEQRIMHVDIFKIDIEGAEREVFSNSFSWIDKVDGLIIELHERMKSGSNRSFYNGSNGFDEEWCDKENVYLARSSGCLKRPANLI
jgi:FkbM family methyltransferase